MADNSRKGSVIVMVVGLLVLLAMIGTTFIIVAHMDRRESASIATAAPMKQVAGGVLQQIRAKLAADLHIDATDVIYGAVSVTGYEQQVDFPHEDYDQHLASFGPVTVMVGGVPTSMWRHISNHDNSAAGGYADVPVDDALLVDTDGYRWGGEPGDAKLFDSGVSNRSGQKYYVAYRLIDASSLMNINSAYSTSAATGGVMPVTNIELDALTSTVVRDSVHNARCGNTGIDTLIYPDRITEYNTRYVQRPLNPNPNLLPPPPNTVFLPFDASDMLALAWGRDVPDAASGRLWQALGVPSFGTAKPYLTTLSASRDYVRQVPGSVNEDLPNDRRIDINDAGVSFENLFNAFYNAIPQGVPGFSLGDPGRRAAAAQLAVNLIDYRDADSDVTVETIPAPGPGPGPGPTVFGIERQPFITEAWLRMEWDAAATPPAPKQWSAIELFNPYKTALSLTGYQLQVGANTNDLQNLPPGVGNMLSPGGRIVIVSSTADIQAAAGTEYEDTNLDLREPCTLFRPASAVDSTLVPVGRVETGEFGLTEPIGAGPAVFAAIRRDDAVARAKYSVAVYKTYTVTYYTGDGAACPTAALTNLGQSNVDTTVGGDATLGIYPAIAVVAPTPVFVRNGDLINLGEVSRIFYKGPSDSEPLDEILASLAPNNVSNGRLYTFGALKVGGWASVYTPDIPPICMLGDYMDVLTPDPANDDRTDTIYGRININTAPWQVIQYLPGISAMMTDIGGGKMLRERVAKDIVAYRDCLNNTAIGGHNYYYNFDDPTDTDNVLRSDVTNTGITDLRQDAGFASPGEIAIPLANIVTPNNIYNAAAPNCYKITVGDDGNPYDDGLDEITGDLSKHDIYYSWLSNQLTVRSDVYIAYIRVQIGDDPATTGAVRRYVAVIDRSNCTSATDMPNVVMFAEMK